ncbi:MAG: phosphoribosyl-AMP cyclohydrolase [Gammaproteobacteria bacterium]|nr:phosphoribosyl-AMP cyclohydrolase [Gammaproteobacteria bacterium]
MYRKFFHSLESMSGGDALPLNTVIENLLFNDSGLIPVITQDSVSKSVLMMAWMNLEALEKTLSTGKVTYWSRSRKALWIKGETSGHTQELVSMSFDCDGDSILCLVNQIGAACHTRRPDCFYLKVDNDEKVVRAQGEGC